MDAWDLTWTSEEVCNAASGEKFKFTVNADCDAKAQPEGSFTWLMEQASDIISLPAAPAAAPAKAAAPASAPVKAAAAAPAAPVCKKNVVYKGPEICRLFSFNFV